MKLKRDDTVRLQHMADAASSAIAFVQDCTVADLQHDLMRRLAIVKLVEIIGEAASRVSEPARESAPEISWRDIVGTRNRLVHAYFDVDLDVLWITATRDLPALLAQLRDVLAAQLD